MFTKRFWLDLTERAVMTAAQSAAAVWGVDTISAFEANWKYIGGVALSAALLSVLKSLYARNGGDPEKASLVQ